MGIKNWWKDKPYWLKGMFVILILAFGIIFVSLFNVLLDYFSDTETPNTGFSIEANSPNELGREDAFIFFNYESIEIKIPTKVDNPLDFNNKPEITISFWANVEETLEKRHFLTWDNRGESVEFISTPNNRGGYDLYFGIFSTNSTKYADKRYIKCSNVSYNQWHLISGAYDSGQIRLFLDGELCEAIAQKGDITNEYEFDVSHTDWYINHFSYGIVWRIDELKIWNRSLSKSEIMNEYNLVNRESGGLAAHYKFDEEGVYDSSGNNNHGNISGNISIERGIDGMSYKFGINSRNYLNKTIRTIFIKNIQKETQNINLLYLVCSFTDRPEYFDYGRVQSYLLFVDEKFYYGDQLEIAPGETKKVDLLILAPYNFEETSFNTLAIFDRRDAIKSGNIVTQFFWELMGELIDTADEGHSICKGSISKNSEKGTFIKLK